MNLFQRVYNWIKDWTTPQWLKDALDMIIFDVVIPTIKELGEEGYNEFVRLIIEASKMDISGQKKFDYVYSEVCKGWARGKANITESFINRAIELVFAELKERKIIS